MADIILHINRLSKQFPDTSLAAISNISLHIQKGEILALTGPSGAGKTTLLKILAGLMLPDQGTVHYQDELVNTYAEELVPGHPDIHLVFQDFKLFPNHTVAENIAYPLKFYEKTIQTESVKELLQFFHLENFAKKYPRELSGGQQQRVALAKAMAAEPEVLLLDEPFSQIDGMLKHEIKQALQTLITNYNTTLVFVTHDTTDALAFAHRIVLINQGCLTQIGSPQEIYQKPINPSVARFFGLCNLLPAHILPPPLAVSKSFQQLACIRPEQFRIVSQKKADFSGKIIHQQFLGNHYVLEVQSNFSQNLLVFSQKPYVLGKSIHLKVEDVHWFETKEE